MEQLRRSLISAVYYPQGGPFWLHIRVKSRHQALVHSRDVPRPRVCIGMVRQEKHKVPLQDRSCQNEGGGIHFCDNLLTVYGTKFGWMKSLKQEYWRGYSPNTWQ